MGEPTPYNVGGIDIAAGSALTVQIPPRVFLGRTFTSRRVSTSSATTLDRWTV